MRINTVISHFWKWFEQHAEEYRGFYTCKKKQFLYQINELNIHLRAYCRHLEGFIGINNTTGKGVLIITARGKARYFGKTDKLVAAAPALEHWHIQSLEPPTPPQSGLEVWFPDVSIDTDRLWFRVLCDEGYGGCKDIIVYSELFGVSIDSRVWEAVRLVMYNILGERLFSLYIRDVRLANLSEAYDIEEVMRLEELPAYINRDLAYMEPATAFEVSASGELRRRRI